MSAAPTAVRAVLFDVNETLTDTSALGGAFEAVGAPGHLAATWFAGVLRDGFALTAAGAPATFAAVGSALARTALAPHVPRQELDDAVARVVGAPAQLPLHPDVAPTVRALHEGGTAVFTLTNGASRVAAALLRAAGLDLLFAALLSVEDSPGGAWKPAAPAYAWACGVAGVAAGEALLVAVHPWDVDGAHRAGLRTAWVDRTGAGWPGVFSAPDLTVRSLEDLPAAVAG